MRKLQLQTIDHELHRELMARQVEQQNRVLNDQLLQEQNLRFANTTGVSPKSGCCGLIPAFLDTESGRAEVSRFADGRAAPIHLLEGLPHEWVARRDADGRVIEARAGIVAGFLLEQRFLTREEAARLAPH